MEFGESVIDAARREAAEESGCAVDDLDLTGEAFGGAAGAAAAAGA